MSSNMYIHCSITFFVLLSFSYSIEPMLQVGFYSKTCPSAEMIVTQQVTDAFLNDNGIAADLLRMHFHDCFVRGCDASILIDSTSNNTAEKDSPVNNPSLRGFDVIDAAKAMLETQCKGIVSCADILAFAARDSIILTQGLSYEVPSGRRDGRVSLASEVPPNIPSPIMNVSQLTTSFANKNLSQKEMVILSGAHTIGRSHCTIITTTNNRLYNFNGTNAPDPNLDQSYVRQLQEACPEGSNDTTLVVPMDPITPLVTDVNYYSNILVHKGLFTSDWTLQTDNATATDVIQYAGNQILWLHRFAAAMVKMGNIDVVTGTSGEIRSNCRVIN